MKMLSKLILATAGALALMTAPVQAATFNWLSFDKPIEIPMMVADTVVNGVEGVTGSVLFEYTSPWDDATTEFTYLQNRGSASYSGFGTVTAIEFLWGTVDNYNSIEFWRNGSLVDTLLGTVVLSDSGFGTGEETGTIEILALAFDQIIFKSTGKSFEYANLRVTAVPLPAALPLYGAGIAVLGFMGWRRRQKAAA